MYLAVGATRAVLGSGCGGVFSAPHCPDAVLVRLIAGSAAGIPFCGLLLPGEELVWIGSSFDEWAMLRTNWAGLRGTGHAFRYESMRWAMVSDAWLTTDVALTGL